MDASEVSSHDGVVSVHPNRETVPPSRGQPNPPAKGRDTAHADAKPPLKIIHIINALSLGGAETLLYRLATEDSTHQHIVVSLSRPDWYSPRLQERDVQVHHLNMNSVAAIPKALLRLNQIVRKSDADVVQCWMYRSNLFGSAIAKLAGKPVVWGIHCSSLEPLKPRSRAAARLGGLLARWNADFVINCSTRSVEIHRSLGYSAVEGAVIHNGYDPRVFFPDEESRQAAREELGLRPDDFAIGSISRWDPQKDIPNLLSALKAVSEGGIHARCFLLGASLGPDNAGLRQMIRDAGCDGLVVPLGPRSDIQNIARALDLHVLSSCGAEAFPNAVAETMLSGTPNAVTDIGDCALMVGQTGWVIEPRDAPKLAEAISLAFHEWRDRPALWSDRRNAARARIAENFSFDRMIASYEEVWRKVAEGSAR